jgi:hypothetical protein
VTVDVPIPVIGVPFWRDVAASSCPWVSFSFIHPNVMPVSVNLPFPPGGKML